MDRETSSSCLHNRPRLDHRINLHFPQLRKFTSTNSLESAPLYRRLKPQILAVLEAVMTENFSPESTENMNSIRAVAWNIERGLKLRGLIQALSQHPVLQKTDIFLMTELDYGMARTDNLHVTREIAQHVEMNYVFAPCYLNLDKGSGLENQVQGENLQALHGNAILSKHPLSEPHSLALPNGKDKMQGKEKRLGCQRAVLTLVEHPLGTFRAVSLHLDAHSSQSHRHLQMSQVLDHLDKWHPSLPTLIGGDWNTSTHNAQRAVYSIFGYARRVFMGIRNVLENHYTHPERWFERHLFQELEERGYIYRNLNQMGACTLHYTVSDLAVNQNMADWIPQWCFWFINWALQDHQGRCSMKLDWFGGKKIAPDPEFPPRVLAGLEDDFGHLSDHEPILLDFRPC